MGKARNTPRGIAEVVTPAAAEAYTDDADFDPEDEARRTAEMLGDLALLNGTASDDVDWIIYRVRTGDEIRAVPGKPRALVTKKHGPMDLGELAREMGGGTFDIYAYYDTGDGAGKCIRKRIRETFEGARIDYTLRPAPPPVVVAAPESVPSGSPNGTHSAAPGTGLTRLERILIHQGKQMDRRFAMMLQAIAATKTSPAPVAPAMGPVEMLAVVKGLHELGRDVQPERRDMDPMAIGKLIFEATNAGVMLGQSREPLPAGSEGEGGSSMMPVIEKALDVFGQFLANHPQARPRSEAHVVPGPARGPDPAATQRVPTQPAVPVSVEPANDIPHQWHTAISSLYRAQAQNEDPRDFAETLRGILRSDEVDDLVNNTEAVVNRLTPIIVGYPQLATPQGQQYFLTVLSELRNPTADEESIDDDLPGTNGDDGLVPAGLDEPDGLHIG